MFNSHSSHKLVWYFENIFYKPSIKWTNFILSINYNQIEKRKIEKSWNKLRTKKKSNYLVNSNHASTYLAHNLHLAYWLATTCTYWLLPVPTGYYLLPTGYYLYLHNLHYYLYLLATTCYLLATTCTYTTYITTCTYWLLPVPTGYLLLIYCNIITISKELLLIPIGLAHPLHL